MNPAAAQLRDRSRWVLRGLVIVAAGFLVLRAILGDVAVGPVWRQLSLMPATLLALYGLVLALRRAPEGGQAPWRLLVAGAAATFVAQLVVLVATAFPGTAARFLPYPFVNAGVLQPFLLAGSALALRLERSREYRGEVALDAALVVVLAVAAFERFMLVPLLASRINGTIDVLMLLVLPGIALCSIFLALVLPLWRESVLPPQAVPSLVGAVTALAGLVIVSWVGVALPPLVLDSVWVLGCVQLGLAGSIGAVHPLAYVRDGDSGAAAARLRQLVVPIAVLILTIGGVDAALQPKITRSGAVVLGIIGVLLVLRSLQALRAAERHTNDRRQLEHTRALVEVSRALAGATEVPATLELVTQWARRLLDAPGAAIELLREDGQLEIMAASGLPPETIGLRYSVENSFTGWVVRSGQARVTDDPSTDPYIQPVSLSFLGHSPVATVPLQYGERTLGVLSCIRSSIFTIRDLELLRALADQAAIAIETAQLFQQVHGLSVTDPLTGLANRRQLERDLAREFAAAQRGRRVVLVLLDLDGFKPYNDRYGHLAGDAALRVFGEVLAATTRAMNLAARYGGDEFVAILSDTDMEGAQVFIERIRSRFPGEIAALGHGTLDVSAGMAEYSPEMQEPEDLLAAADRALYEAKAQRVSR